MESRLALIVNPNAGKKKGRIIAAEAQRRFEDLGCQIGVFESLHPGGTRELAAGLDLAAWEGIVVVGGDGSLFEVLNGLSGRIGSFDLPIGQIPVGTGNSFIKDLGIETVDDAVACIAEGAQRPVDVGRFSCDAGEFRFINLLGAGFVSNVARRAGKYKFFGPLSYIFGVIEEVIRMDIVPIKLTVDGESIEREALFVEICNSRFTGGDMMMAPSAEVDDGLLDIVVMNRASRRRVLALLPKIFSGAHVEAPEIEVFRGKNITLESTRPMALTPDGEVFGSTPIVVSVESKVIRMWGRSQ